MQHVCRKRLELYTFESDDYASFSHDFWIDHDPGEEVSVVAVEG